MLILALGARARAGVPGALTFRDQRDVPRFQRLLRELETLRTGRLVFVVPPGCTWPLPLYELALRSCAHAAERHMDLEVTLVSPERMPLAVFGADASRLVAELLAQRGVRFIGGTTASEVRSDGSVVLEIDGAIKADRVVAVPQLRANPVIGVPGSWWGFVPTDSSGRVERLVDVYAAGDMTTFPIKQGGIAAQQADRIAATIAAGLGVPVPDFRAATVLGARLVGGACPLFLCVELDALGQPSHATLVHDETDAAASSTKVFGRYLTPYLEARDRLARAPATIA